MRRRTPVVTGSGAAGVGRRQHSTAAQCVSGSTGFASVLARLVRSIDSSQPLCPQPFTSGTSRARIDTEKASGKTRKECYYAPKYLQTTAAVAAC